MSAPTLQEQLPKTDAATPRPGWGAWQWFVIPLLVLLAVEVVMRPWIAQREAGYYTKMYFPPRDHVDGVFIGLSRVEAALNLPAFDARLSQGLGHPWRSVNLGGGGRLLTMHYMGLRNLFAAYPERFKGATIFLEAPYRLPDAMLWNDPWCLPRAERPLVATMNQADLQKLLHTDADLADKALFVSLYAQRCFKVLYYRRLIHRRFIDRIDEVSRMLGQRVGILDADSQALDMQSHGTIRIDPEAIAVGKRDAEAWMKGEMPAQRPVANWDQTVLGDLARLAQENGGRLVLFEMPVSTFFRPAYESAVRRSDCAKLDQALPQLGATRLRADFAYNDEDFPDTWHLRSTRTVEFSTRLAEAYLKKLELAPAH